MDVPRLLRAVDPARLAHHLFYLASDPLPCRTLNYRLSGHARCTLYEADDYITGILRDAGCRIESEAVPVQAFVPDASTPWGFRKPTPDEPWYDAFNIVATKPGSAPDAKAIVLIAHKDSQSWLDCGPGAYDNAVGVSALLEISTVLSGLTVKNSVLFLFCNEEHWPWTSVSAARRMVDLGLDIAAVLNVDSIGGKSRSQASEGRLTSVARFTTPEGEALADFISSLNTTLGIGLDHRNERAEFPNDDDGSFVNAGILPTVLLIGSLPYADPNYHTLGDTPDKVDVENICRATQLALATVLALQT